MARILRVLVLLMGVACVAIGAFHFSLGIASVPGEHEAGATVDSRERYYGAIFAGYGLAWLWAARQRPVPAPVVRWLAWTFWVGGFGRLLSMAVHGQPQWFQVVLTVIELALPPLYLYLADADERATRGGAGPAPTDPAASPAAGRSGPRGR